VFHGGRGASCHATSHVSWKSWVRPALPDPGRLANPFKKSIPLIWGKTSGAASTDSILMWLSAGADLAPAIPSHTFRSTSILAGLAALRSQQGSPFVFVDKEQAIDLHNLEDFHEVRVQPKEH
jgi:hypothetical protein